MTPSRRLAPVRFVGGIGDLARGFRLVAREPRLLVLGAIPAVIVGAVFLAGFLVIVAFSGPLAHLVTPFADTWTTAARDLLRAVVVAAIVVLAGIALVLLYVAVVLATGDVFYDRIARGVDRALGGVGEHPDAAPSGLAAIGDGLSLVGRGAATGVATFALGLIPVVGPALSAVVGALVGGRLIAGELTDRAFEGRGMSREARRAALASDRSRTTGFGAAAWALLFIPVVSVVTMPAAVAGGVVLARRLLGESVERT